MHVPLALYIYVTCMVHVACNKSVITLVTLHVKNVHVACMLNALIRDNISYIYHLSYVIYMHCACVHCICTFFFCMYMYMHVNLCI